MSNTFLEALTSRPLVGDGAMGTQLYERGVFINQSLEEACLRKPKLVKAVHEAYVAAGADLIQSHTFAANRIRLAKHGLDDKVLDINQAAVELALEASGGKTFVAGSVGPTGLTPAVVTDEELEAMRAAFREQAEVMAKAGVDVIMLETFRQLSEIRLAIKAVRDVTDLPIVAQMAFDECRTQDGADPARVVQILKSAGAQVVGANCIEGPKGAYAAVETMVGHGVPIIVQPNAGYPRHQDGRMIYMATPEYFGVYARRFFKLGVSMVGGCCGTSPEHIQRIVGAARMMGGGRVGVAPALTATQEQRLVAAQLKPVPTPEKTALSAKIDRVYRERVLGKRAPLCPDNFVVSVEVNPPAGLNPAKAMAAAKMLREHKVDVINIADGPRASVRMSNSALATLLRQDLGTETILHVCCRDRNLLGLQADLLANHVLGLHNLVIITGDPPKMGDYPHATAVFDLDSIGLLKLASGLNRGLDPAGKPMSEVTRFYCACGAEPAALDYDRELRRLETKKAAGAEFIMTQPVYDPAVLRRFLNDTKHLNMPVLVGLLPLASYRNAEFLHNEVPGMQIPDVIRRRMKEFDRGPEARAEGVKIAQEALLEVVDDVVGAYIMPPFGRYQAALEILECVGYPQPE